MAQTGTGKTAAFALPTLHLLFTQRRPALPKRPRALILTPTRELAAQITQNFDAYGKHLGLSYLVLFGGAGQTPQVQKLGRGVDILVATPGRLLDLHAQSQLHLNKVEIFVLDEADRMLDLGFVHDVKKVMALLPAKRQSLLFSATMPPAIQQLADRLLHDPVRVEVTPVASTAERIQQRVCFVEWDDKLILLPQPGQDVAQKLLLAQDQSVISVTKFPSPNKTNAVKKTSYYERCTRTR